MKLAAQEGGDSLWVSKAIKRHLLLEEVAMTFWHEPIYHKAIEELGDALMDGASLDELVRLTWVAVAFGMVQP